MGLRFPGFTAILDKIPDLGGFFVILIVQSIFEFLF